MEERLVFRRQVQDAELPNAGWGDYIFGVLSCGLINDEIMPKAFEDEPQTGEAPAA